MGEKLIVGPINRGLVNNRTAFNIDNDAFPTLLNAYQWRGRVKRKRGTSLLGRLNTYIGTTDGSGNLSVTISPTPITSGVSQFVVGSTTFTDPGGSSPVNLLSTDAATATLNRSSGALSISGASANTAVYFYPGLPVMGLEDFMSSNSSFPGTVAFDTIYAYSIATNSPYSITGVNYYNNPATGTYSGYTQKSNWTAISWNGQNYQQFWTTNYQGALWATNGITNPFSTTNIGMQYKAIVAVTVLSATTANLQITAHGLVVGDFVFINEVSTTTGINFQTGYVTTVTDANNVTVTFPNANIATNGTGGIAQYLTSRSDITKDCIRWYNGDPTNSGVPGVTGQGWVNFCPPLSQGSYSIADLPAAQYYLVGARMILPFKDRLLFFGPVVQTSAANSQKYLQDTIIYSQNGTPYYTASFNGSVSSASTTFNSILVPSNQTATANAFFEDQTGFGGFFTAGLDQPINTVSANEDVLILGFNSYQARLIYTGNDLIPFNLYVINSELGSTSTFSAVNLDKGVITRGSRGIVITSQTGAARIDLDIPDEVFRISLSNNGTERICAQRDYINEWIYITYPANYSSYTFPNQTLMYNYRDDSWGIFRENYTTYGLFRKSTGFTWATIGSVYPTWQSWNEPWAAGDSTLLNPDVIAGNQQGFVLVRDTGTQEGNSLYIQNISGTTVTSPNHCLNNGDYIIISGCSGTVGSIINGKIFQVANASTNTFSILANFSISGTYLGGGVIKRCYIPFIQTKQFPVSWGMGRKTRIGAQQYLFTTTYNSQITLLIFLSQNDNDPYNNGPIVPSSDSDNDSLIYSTVLYTCPEAENIGLTPSNINLNLITAVQQQQTWHRMNTSLLGDTVQIGFTISGDQMTSVDSNGSPINAFSEVELHSMVLDLNPSQWLS